MGAAGFALVCAWQGFLFVLLGACWYVLLPASPGWRLRVLIWARMVRDAVGTCLPFSVVGGFVFGARAATLFGVAWPVSVASTVVDLAAEFLAQVGLVLVGVVILITRVPGSAATMPLILGLLVALVAAGSFLWLLQGADAPLMRISRRLLGGWLPRGDGQMDAVQASLAAISAAPWRVGACVGLHFLGWFGTGVASWIAFRLLGAKLDFWGALGIEALLHAVLAMAILVPGYAGVQEAAYAGVGALFGQPAEISLGVSLLRRARDLALGIPILLLWQAIEWRRRATPRAPGSCMAACNSDGVAFPGSARVPNDPP